jgi:hypothetical protein
MEQYHGTTILSVRRGNSVALGGDGQVTLGNIVIKQGARKVRRLYQDRILAGFAGAALTSSFRGHQPLAGLLGSCDGFTTISHPLGSSLHPQSGPYSDSIAAFMASIACSGIGILKNATAPGSCSFARSMCIVTPLYASCPSLISCAIRTPPAVAASSTRPRCIRHR